MTPTRGPKRSSYSMPGSGAGFDDFRGKLEPRPDPVDDLSRFVLDRIREAETEPVADQVPERAMDQPMAYRYAGYVRKDCEAFRKIMAEYVADVDPVRSYAFGVAVRAIAERWSGHPDFKAEWSWVPRDA